MSQYRPAESQISLIARLRLTDPMTEDHIGTLSATAHTSWAAVSSATHLHAGRIIIERSPTQITCQDLVEYAFDQPAELPRIPRPALR
jgi:hypothetical protein